MKRNEKMIFELIYTSASKGLRPGTSGYTTVAHTEGMPLHYIQLCESLSGYIYLYSDVTHEKYHLNPVAYSHYQFTVKDQRISILSRITAYHADYTGRVNKLAHHVMISPDHFSVHGPAWLMQQPGFFVEQWDGELRLLSPKPMPFDDTTQEEVYFGRHWEYYCGDAGIAGMIAQKALDHSKTPSLIIFEPGMNTLPLITEALNLIPPEKRWDITFNTYFTPTTKPIDSECLWRCCIRDSHSVQPVHHALWIDIANKKIENPVSDHMELVQCARSGAKPSWVVKKQALNTDLSELITEDTRSSIEKNSSQESDPTVNNDPILVEMTNRKSNIEHLKTVWMWLFCIIFILSITVIYILAKKYHHEPPHLPKPSIEIKKINSSEIKGTQKIPKKITEIHEKKEAANLNLPERIYFPRNTEDVNPSFSLDDLKLSLDDIKPVIYDEQGNEQPSIYDKGRGYFTPEHHAKILNLEHKEIARIYKKRDQFLNELLVISPMEIMFSAIGFNHKDGKYLPDILWIKPIRLNDVMLEMIKINEKYQINIHLKKLNSTWIHTFLTTTANTDFIIGEGEVTLSGLLVTQDHQELSNLKITLQHFDKHHLRLAVDFSDEAIKKIEKEFNMLKINEYKITEMLFELYYEDKKKHVFTIMVKK
ncbi:MAG: hypothetical protein HQK77_06295 [Desulfobacterales bacterium]|nr:hypothetical protein [Desulfobacterales bacterium]